MQHAVLLMAMPCALIVQGLSCCVPQLLCYLTDERAVDLRHFLGFWGRAVRCQHGSRSSMCAVSMAAEAACALQHCSWLSLA